MSPIEFMFERFKASAAADAIVWRDRATSYGELLDLLEAARADLARNRVRPCSVVTLEADFSPRSIAFLLALVDHGCAVVPLTASVASKIEEFRKIAEAEYVVKIAADDRCEVTETGTQATHPLIARVKGMHHPALILFSSGTTGTSKAAIHDFLPLLEKFKIERKSKRMISFLLFDHIGGINTLFYVLANAGTLVTVGDRSPQAVVDAIEKHRVQVLPTSPTFLNLLLMSEAYRGRDLSSLELITYGTEPMPESTLLRSKEAFGWVEFLQTYGLSELGILRSKSKSSDSLWVKIGGEGFETRVREGLLEIKAKSAMLGYLNAASPFTDDGWFKTGDVVEVEGDYMRILGRKSDIINVGGEKVYPSEVESALLRIKGVEEAVVTGEPNPIVGNMVKATVRLSTSEKLPEFRVRMKTALAEAGLAKFKIPQKVVLIEVYLHSARFKTVRNV